MDNIITNMIQVHVASKRNDNEDYCFLLLKRAESNIVYPSIWQVVTGTIEKNETPIQTAIREVKEETGLSPLKIWTIPYVSFFYDYQKNKINAVPVFGILTNYYKNIIISNEHQSFKWASFDEAVHTLPLPQHVEALRIFKQYILEKQDNSLFQIKAFPDEK